MTSISAINISKKKGDLKSSVEKGYFKVNYGLVGDTHAGNLHRQVSLFAQESINKIKDSGINGLCTDKFVENLTTEGIILHKLPVGTKIKAGEVVLEVTEIGKACYKDCEIRNSAVNCALSRECIFAKVLNAGWIKKGDKIETL